MKRIYISLNEVFRNAFTSTFEEMEFFENIQEKEINCYRKDKLSSVYYKNKISQNYSK